MISPGPPVWACLAQKEEIIMNALNTLITRTVSLIWRLALLILTPVRKLAGAVLGHWQAPGWVHWGRELLAPIGHTIANHAALTLLAILLAMGAAATPRLMKYDWQAFFDSFRSVRPTRQTPLASGVTATGPARTAIETGGKPNPAVLVFSTSAAPLAKIGKEIGKEAGKETGDIKLSPAIAGKWIWTSPTQLEFTPASDWPIDVEYKVTLGAKAVAPHVRISGEVSFRTPRFEMTMREASFYQDPVQFNLRKAVFEVAFTHPVDTEAFEKRLKLTPGSEAPDLLGKPAKPGQASAANQSNSQPKLSVTYDKFKLLATVFSNPLPIPEQAASLTLTIEQGVPAQRGGNATANDVTKALSIPGLYSLDISELKQLIVTGDNGDPENMLQISTGMSVHEKEMTRAVQAFLLPETRKGEDGDSNLWSDPAEVTPEVLKQSKPIKLNMTPAEREVRELHAMKFAAEPGRFMLVRIQKGLKSIGGYQLGAERMEIFRIKRSAPELAIMSKGSLLALSGEKKLPLLVRDVPGVKIELARLLPQQLQHLVTQAEGDMTKPEFYSRLTPDNLTERFEKKIVLSNKPGKTSYENVDFAEYLHKDASDRRGIFILTVQAFDPAVAQGESANDRADRRAYYTNSDGETNEGDNEAEPNYNGNNENGEPEQVDYSKMRDRRLVIVTDLGIVSKMGVDGSRDVFVQSIHDGQPVAGATVEILARNGAVLVSQNTDASGQAHLPSVAGMLREKLPVALLVKKAGDVSYLPLNRADRNLDVSRFDVSGVISTGLPNQMQGYLFSDRGIYRPGDTMNIGIIVKSLGWIQKLTDLPVEAEVIDARGLLVRRQKLKLGAGGMAEFTHSTQDSSPTGNYTINLNLGRDSGSSAPGSNDQPGLQLATLSVKVQEFMPDRMKVTARLSRENEGGWVTPDQLTAKINVQNLFGTPAPERRVEAHLSLQPAYPGFSQFPTYQFYDPLRGKDKHEEDLAKASTDAQGDVSFNLGMERFQNATFQLHLLAKAFEPEGGRSVSAETTALVSDRPFLLGYKTDTDLSYVKRNSVQQVNLIAIDPKAKATAVKQLKLMRIERRVVSVLIKQSNGLFKYESRPSETVLNEAPFAIAASGASVPLATQSPGNFAYEVRDGEGLVLARFEYTVAGTGNVSRSLDRNAELQLSLNKKDFNPGEEIEINIRAPYVGAGLITIERDKVFTHKWFRTSETASLQKITLPKDFEGSGYISVQFIRDIASNEIYMSPMSHGVVPFATSLGRRTNAIKLSAPAMVKPGQEVKIRLEAKNPGRAVVFAVDEGILQVARYQNPDPLKHFFQKRALQVTTQQTLDLILPEFKKLITSAAPGGDAAGLLGKNLNPFKRKTDKPVVYWSGVVDVDGSREFSYTVPEYFNGSLRIMAVVINDDTAAASATATTVRGDLILLPNLPLAITPGDEVEIGIGVANNAKGSGKDAPVSLALSVTPGLEVVGEAQKVLKISERSEGSTKFLVRARPGEKAVLGSASVIFTAQVNSAGGKAGEAKARLSTDVSVRPASAYVTLVQTGVFKGSGEIKSQANMYPNFQRSEAAISASPWAFSSGLIQYLDVYPHGCTEQITSQIFPAVLIGSQTELAKQLLKTSRSGSKSVELPDPRKSLDRYLAQVRSRQTTDGGFGMWPGAGSDLFATTYVTQLLLEARERKLPVPNDILQKTNGYLQRQLSTSASDLHFWRAQTFAAYLLTRQGINASAALTNLREQQRNRISNTKVEADKASIRRDLGSAYLAASFQILKQEGLAQELLDPAFAWMLTGEDHKRFWYWYYYYDPMVHDAAIVALVGKHFPQRLKDVPEKYWTRLANQVRDGYYQSHSAAMIMLAVDSYAKAASESAAGKVGLSAIDAKGVAKAMELPKQFILAQTSLPLSTARVKLTNQGELPLFYSWAEAGFERALPKEAISQGMEIIHEVLNADGKVVTEATLGEELTMRVRVRATERSHVAQVALVDLLPGGLEPVLNGPSDSDDPETPLWRRRLGGKSSWSLTYADIREDRVVFYGDVSSSLTEVTYKVRATNVGSFVVPPAYGEAMYEHRIFARSKAGSFTVKAAK
jgi:alpha-2-macroglobulin